MRKWLSPGGVVCLAVVIWGLTGVSAHNVPQARQVEGWYRNRPTMSALATLQIPREAPSLAAGTVGGPTSNGLGPIRDFLEGKRLFERETFGGNGRTCQTCHDQTTGTVSPEDAQERFRKNRRDPLFVHDGSDDEDGDGFGDGRHVTRMLNEATVLMRIPLHSNVTVKDDPTARVVTLARGIPTTLNTPALDKVLMLDGRQPTLRGSGTRCDHRPCAGDASGSASRAGADRQVPTALSAILHVVRARALLAGRSGTTIATGSHRLRETRPQFLRRPAAGLLRHAPELQGRARARPVTVGRCSIRRISSCRCPRFRPARAFRRCSCRNSVRAEPCEGPDVRLPQSGERPPRWQPGRHHRDHQHRPRTRALSPVGPMTSSHSRLAHSITQRVQDLAAPRDQEDGAVLPRQLREDAGGRRRALSTVLPDRHRRARRALGPVIVLTPRTRKTSSPT